MFLVVSFGVGVECECRGTLRCSLRCIGKVLFALGVPDLC